MFNKKFEIKNSLFNELMIGDVFQVLPIASSSNIELQSKYYCEFIGMLPDYQLFLKLPKNTQKQNFTISVNQTYTFRTLIHGSLHTFTSKVEKIVNCREPYIHVNYPNECKRHELRSARRVTLFQRATVLNYAHEKQSNNSEKIYITDISVSGAGVVSHKELGNRLDMVILNTSFFILDKEYTIQLPGVIRQIHKDINVPYNFKYYYGLSLEIDDPDHKDVLYSIVHQSLFNSKTVNEL